MLLTLCYVIGIVLLCYVINTVLFCYVIDIVPLCYVIDIVLCLICGDLTSLWFSLVSLSYYQSQVYGQGSLSFIPTSQAVLPYRKQI